MKQQKDNINTTGMWDTRYSGGKWRVFPYEVIYEKYLKDRLNITSFTDYGCGLGEGVEYLAKHFPKATFWGLDFSSVGITKAKHLPHNFEVADFNEDFTPRPSDMAIVSHTLEHIDRPMEFLEKIKPFHKEILLSIPLETEPQGEHKSTFDLTDFKVEHAIVEGPNAIIIMKGEL